MWKRGRIEEQESKHCWSWKNCGWIIKYLIKSWAVVHFYFSEVLTQSDFKERGKKKIKETDCISVMSVPLCLPFLIKKKDLNPPHIPSCSSIPVERRWVAGHEEEDVWLRTGGDVTERLEMAHDIQSASLVNQPGVKSCKQVGRKQTEGSRSSPLFQRSQWYPCHRH